MLRISNIEIQRDSVIKFYFSDGSEKIIDFKEFIGDDSLSSPLKDPDYFRKVELYEGGRGIYWPNEFDFCPDFLKSYKNQSEKVI